MTYHLKLLGGNFVEFQSLLGYSFNNPKLLIEAFTHKSAFNGQKERLLESNERLEFLGDAVVDLIMSDILMKEYPDNTEGDLTKKRASLVNEFSLFEIAINLELEKYVQLGRSEVEVGMNQNQRILASCFEALMGALYLDGGFEVVRKVVEALFRQKIEKLKQGVNDFEDFKTQLQEKLQKKFRQTPLYSVTGSTGPEHQKIFEVEVLLDGKVLAKANGRNKKIAEQNAARIALEDMT
ncbi:MAG: ribonuclease III [Bdellovibrionota bacterium]